ncbi:MAG: hypothetical protein WCK00_15190, partial [Deltaproteobacteria bacterium]
CSALKETHRAAAMPPGDCVKLVHLTGSFDLILGRMNARQGHFMKPEMLESQFATLETPTSATAIDIASRKPMRLMSRDTPRAGTTQK